MMRSTSVVPSWVHDTGIRSGGVGQAAGGQEPAVVRSLLRLEAALQAIDKTVGQLTERLAPVLIPQPPTNSQDGQPKGPPACPLAGRIDNVTETLSMVASRVQDLTERLQV